MTEEFSIPKEWEKDFLGGASLAARILFSSLTKELDPLSPEAPSCWTVRAGQWTVYEQKRRF
ncbi:MAG: hypothetical protein ACKOBD_15695, partial [Chloroflexota bacterium]